MSEEFSHGCAVIVSAGADLPVTVRDARAVVDLLRLPARS